MPAPLAREHHGDEHLDFKLPCKLLRVQLSQRRHSSRSRSRR
jgi:hypothetical protein